MGWHGSHAWRTKAEVKKLLPPGACKQCVYWFRLFIGRSSDVWFKQYPICERCGIRKWDILDELTEKTTIYEPQLKLYATALSRIYRKPVCQSWIYFLALRQAVEIGHPVQLLPA